MKKDGSTKKLESLIKARIKQERKRIHQDAHDKVYNRLGALAKRTENLSIELASQKRKLDDINNSLRQTIGDLQDIISGNLNSQVFTPAAFTQTQIRKMFQEHVLNYRQELAFTCQSGQYHLIDNKSTWHLQCILQECLNNAGKHSQAKRIDVQLSENGNQVIMKVIDDGRGFENNKATNGQGLKSIKKRVNYLGGNLNFDTSAEGTEVTVSFPI